MARLAEGDWSSRSFQFFSLFRYLGLLLSAIALARLFPDQSLIADYERLLLLGGSVTFFWAGGLFDAFVVVFKQAGTEQRPQTAAALNGLALSLALLSGLSVFLLGFLLFPSHFDADTLAAYAVFTAADSYALALVYLLHVHGRSRELIAYAILSYTAYFAVLILLVQGGDLARALWGLALLAAAKALYTAIRFGIHRQAPAWNPASRQLLRTGTPLALAALLSYSANYLDGYLVAEFFPADFATFRYGAKELPLVLLLANALSIVQSGEVAEGIREQDPAPAIQKLKAGGLRLMHLLFPLSILLLIASDWLFRTVFGPAFAGAAIIFDIYLLLAIPRLIFPQSLLRAHQMTRLMGLSAGIELFANVALSLLGMYLFGIAGIAAATVLAYLLEKTILVAYCKSRLGISFRSYTAAGWWAAYAAALSAAWALKYLLFAS